jgi:hypothetical protein
LCAGRHRADIELVCDDEAAWAGTSVFAYAQSIVRVARTLAASPGEAGAMMTAHGLAARMRSLMERKGPMPETPNFMKIAACAVAGAGAALTGRIDLVAAEEIAMRPPAASAGLVYVDVGSKIDVRIEEIGARCSDNAQCHFEAPLGLKLVLRATRDRPGEGFAWSGCEPGGNGSSCTVLVGETASQVRVKAR